MDTDRSISRRDALKKGALVGAVAWSVPVIQSVTNKASAQTSPNTICSKLRIQDGGCGTVGSQSCLPSLADQNCCDPINTSAATPILDPDDAESVICLDPGCEVEGVGLKSAQECLFSPQNPANPNQGLPVPDEPPAEDGDVRWSGWFVDASNCLHVPRMEEFDSGDNLWKPKANGHIDVIVCCPRTGADCSATQFP